MGLDNGGKTSILLLLNKRFSLLCTIKPTIKANRNRTSVSILGLDISSWDLGGQKNFREEYLKNKDKFFTHVQSLFFVIDVQKRERFEEALIYLQDIVNTVLELNPNYAEISKFTILFHKFDPDIAQNEEILTNVKYLEEKIKLLHQGAKFSFFKTSIYDDASLIRAFSEGAISITHKSKLIQNLLKEYTKTTFSSSAVFLDQQSFIIASRSTKESYQEICESIAPRLAYAMERLEEWGIDTVDIVTNIKFPQDKFENNREGLIFLTKFDLKGDLKIERLYLITLCLNKKVKDKSYEYLPILAKNLKNLLESF